MPTERTTSEPPDLASVAAAAATEKFGRETVVLEVGDLLEVFEAFVVTSGANARQIDTMVDAIEAATKASCGRGPLRIEGRDDATWVLMDYGEVLVHVFAEEARAFYDLEHLWSNARRRQVDAP